MNDAPAGAVRQNPFKGLGNYGLEDASYFFGRNRERDIVAANLRARRLTVLYGPSGVGKSSLLRAGVEAQLRTLASANLERLGGAEIVPVVFSRWQDDPATDLAEAICTAVAQVTGSEPTRGDSLAETIANASTSTDASFLVILDQFEDLAFYHGPKRGESGFDLDFPELVTQNALPVNFLISIREDALAQLDRFKSSIPGMLDSRLSLSHLTGEAAEAAIREPIRFHNKLPGTDEVTVDDAVVAEVLRQLRVRRIEPTEEEPSHHNGGEINGDRHAEPGVEAPYLNLVMWRLWEKQVGGGRPGGGRRVLDLGTLEQVGSAKTIVDDHIRETLGDLPADQRSAAVDVFKYLVTPSRTKVTNSLSTLVEWSHCNEKVVSTLLDGLAGDVRIIRKVSPDPGTNDPRYEIFHDLLGDGILRWRAGELKERALAEERTQLERQRAADREELERRQAAERVKLAFEHELQRRRAFLRLVVLACVTALAVVTAIVVVIVIVASADRRVARAERAAADYSELTSKARLLAATRPDVALLLALSAYRKPPPGVRRALSQSALVAALQTVQQSGATAILHGDTDAITSVAFSPSTRMLASSSADGTIRIWDPASHRQLQRLAGTYGEIFAIAFSPDGRRLAAGAGDGTVRLIDTATGHKVGPTIQATQGDITSIAFSPDRGTLAAATLNRAITVVALRNDEPIGPPAQLPGAGMVRAIAFDPKLPATLASVGADRKVSLWNADGRKQLGKPITLNGALYGLAFNPVRDGQLAVGGLSGDIWLVDTRSASATMLGNGGGAVNGLAFDSGGRTLASAQANDAVQLWDVVSRAKLGSALAGHTGLVRSVAFNATGDLLASGSADRTIRLWAVPYRNDFGQPIVNMNYVNSVAFDSDGKRFAAGGKAGIRYWTVAGGRAPSGPGTRLTDIYSRQVAFGARGTAIASADFGGRLRVWDLARPASPQSIAGNPVLSLAFSPDGQTLALAGSVTISLVHPFSGRSPVTLPDRSGNVFTIAFNRSGTELAAGGDDRTLRVWNIASKTRVAKLIGHSDAVFSTAFSPDGRTLVSGSADNSVRLWRLPSGRPLGYPLEGHAGYVRGVAFSPSGAMVVSSARDGTIRFWDVGSGTQLGMPLSVNASGLEAVRFTLDGTSVVTGGADGAVRVWPAPPRDYATARLEVCALLGGGLSRAEWSLYAGGLPYDNPCR